jgi:hypothetical protein
MYRTEKEKHALRNYGKQDNVEEGIRRHKDKPVKRIFRAY